VNDAQLQRYSRHILLDEIGIEAQARLMQATVLVIGAGGLGSPVAMYLACAGIGHLVIADGDLVDLTNLQRQIMHTTERVGHSKVSSAAQTLNALNPEINITTIAARLSGTALREQVARATVVVDCTDNFATRHEINRACVAAKVPLVSGAAIRFDGQLMVFDSRAAHCACYHCVFPESAQAPEEVCALMGVFAPLTGMIGTMQAAAALKIAGQFGDPGMGQLVLVDALNASTQSIQIQRDPQCSVCAAPKNT
jgi:molybdopterin-synthase adenylyltransferase